MLQNPDRVEQFRAEIAEMRIGDTASSRDRKLLVAGAVAMGVGLVITIVAYVIGHATTNPLQQRDAIVIAVIGLTTALIGAAVFVRYSIAQFLRFWMARLSWEQQAQTDRMVGALGPRD